MNKLDIVKWKEFKIGDLFDIHPTKSYKMNNNVLLEQNGINPVVVNSSYNNGMVDTQIKNVLKLGTW